MEFFQHRYYRINKILMTISGQWPYQSTRVRCVIYIVIFVFLTSLFVPQILAIVKVHNDWGYLVECIAPLIFNAACVVKIIYSISNTHKMLKLLNHIRADWQVWARDREIKILHEYAEQGRKLTIVYAVILYSFCVLSMTVPVIPKIIDVSLMNGSKPGEFPFPVNYYHIDMQIYYFYIIAHCYVCVTVEHLIVISCDVMFIIYVQHCCGTFAALGRKLDRIGKNERSADTGAIAYPLNKGDIDFERLLSCIDRHNRAIKSAELIEAIYSWHFFFNVGFNVVMISVSGVQAFSGTIEPHETTRFIVISAITMGHLYCEIYMAQTLMDHSIDIRYNILNVKWYRLSLKAQKLLPLMLMRCNEPCKLTAGKISVMSVETFGLMRTSLSYFTVLRSI